MNLNPMPKRYYAVFKTKPDDDMKCSCGAYMQLLDNKRVCPVCEKKKNKKELVKNG